MIFKETKRATLNYLENIYLRIVESPFAALKAVIQTESVHLFAARCGTACYGIQRGPKRDVSRLRLDDCPPVVWIGAAAVTNSSLIIIPVCVGRYSPQV